MRILNIVCGIAVLLTTLHFGHGMHHFTSHDGVHGSMWLAMAGAVITALFSLIGGPLLIRRSG